MPTQLDSATRAELKTERDKVAARRTETADRMAEMRDSDASLDNSKWNSLTDAFYADSAIIDELDDRLAKMPEPVRASQSQLKRTVEQDPTARYVAAAARTGRQAGGLQGLEAWEIGQQAQLADDYGLGDEYREGDLVVPVDKQNAVFTTTTAAEVIPTTTSARMAEVLAAFGGARSVCYDISTASGEDIKFPRSDNASAEGELVQEGVATNEQDLATPGAATLSSYLYSSKHTDISRSAVSDAVAGFSVIDYTLRQATRRLARIINKHASVGTGTNQPEGFWTKAVGNTLHTTVKGGGAEYLTYADLVHCTHAASISPYVDDNGEAAGGFMAMRGFTGFTFNRVLEGVLMRMVDGDNRPLWSPGLSSIAGDPRRPTILGYPYVTNAHLPSNMAKNQPIAAFGNIGSSHAYRSVGAILIRSFYDSATASRGDTMRILGFGRFDARYIGAGASSAVEFGVLKTKNADAA